MGTPSENIIRLKELSQKLLHDDHEVILKKLKDVVEQGKKELLKASSSQSKIKCYEKMCVSITSILNEVKL